MVVIDAKVTVVFVNLILKVFSAAANKTNETFVCFCDHISLILPEEEVVLSSPLSKLWLYCSYKRFSTQSAIKSSMF